MLSRKTPGKRKKNWNTRVYNTFSRSKQIWQSRSDTMDPVKQPKTEDQNWIHLQTSKEHDTKQ